MISPNHRTHFLLHCRSWWLCVSGSLLVSFLLAVSQAQITLDGSLGPSGSLNGPDYTIPAAVGQMQGSNLFHSFGQFHIRTGESATFTGPDTIANILSRVTGGQPSGIDGLLRSEIPGANLYLLNPSGVLFGPNARLDVRGSFYVSTADVLRLGDDGMFYTGPADESVLTMAHPAAFGFLQAQPAAVTLQGSQLHVPTGATVSLVGGNLTIAGNPAATAATPTLGAASGQVHLVSVASPGEVRLTTAGPTPPLDVTSFERLGTIMLTDTARIDASGEGGGAIVIRGGKITVSSASIVTNTLGGVDDTQLGIDLHVTGDATLTHGSLIQTVAMGAGDAGDIRLSAGHVQLDMASFLGSRTFAAGRAGDILLEAGSVTVRAGAQIESRTFGSGAGGVMTVRATEALTLEGIDPATGFPGGIFADAQGQDAGAGAAGTLRVEAGSIAIRGGAQISGSTFGPGAGGDVSVTASEALILEGADPTNRFPSGLFVAASGQGTEAGAAGMLRVAAGSITVRAGALIDSSTIGLGAGGVVSVTASEALILEGTNPVNGFPSGIFAEAAGQDVGAGAAGTLRVAAGSVTVRAGAVISSATFGPGAGGDVSVMASETLTLEDTDSVNGFPSGIFADAVGQDAEAGDAGTLRVEARSITVRSGAVISSSTFGPGTGGDVSVTASETLNLEGFNRVNPRFATGIFASAEGPEVGAGAAGTLRVEASNVMLRAGAQIGSGTFGPGQGGDVSVMASEALTLEGTDPVTGAATGIFASTEGQGRGGDILLHASTLTLTDGASIAAESTGAADAGSIRLAVTESFLSQHSTVTTEARLADGGNIQVTAQTLIRLQDSAITATVGGGAETVGGNITIDPEFVILEDSQILAEAFQGQGGNIGLTAEVVLANPASRISASSTLGIDGSVDIRAPVRNLSGTVAPLPQTFQQVAALLQQHCAERLRGSPASSFVLGGRDSVPAAPSGVLPSLLYEAHTGATNRVATRVADEAMSSPPATLLHIDNNGYLQVNRKYTRHFPQTVLGVECAK